LLIAPELQQTVNNSSITGTINTEHNLQTFAVQTKNLSPNSSMLLHEVQTTQD